MRQKTFGLASLHLAPGEDEDNVRASPTGLASPTTRRARTDEKQLLLLAFIDPKPLTRHSILETLTRELPDYMIVAAASCEELLKMKGGRPGCPDLLVIHTRSSQLTDAWVQDTLELVRRHLAGTSVVLLSDRDDVDDVARALTFGVRGYIPTSAEVKVVFAALQLVNAGGIFVPAHALRSAPVKPDIGFDRKQRQLPEEIALTPREHSVVALLREGKPNKLIAAELKLQESTVKVHVRNIFKKLRVANRTHAAFVANRVLDYQSTTAIASGQRLLAQCAETDS
jgi:DNA-binding NarL/FixJ family response regulator